MLHLIVTGRAADLSRFRTAALSVAAHAGLVFAAVSGRPSSNVRAPRGITTAPPLERVHFIVAAPPRAEAKSSSATRVKRSASRGAPQFGAPKLALSIPTDIAPPTAAVDDETDFTSKVADSLDFKPRTLAEAIGLALVNKRTPPANGVYTAEGVDRVVTPLRNPKPVYPRSLEAQGVEADFTVRFVVDSTGRVDASTLDMPGGVHRLFADAVRYALTRSRFLPAQIAGHPVRQLVAQEFIFRMPR
jgi:outer membrane biosynthesis protein TonB